VVAKVEPTRDSGSGAFAEVVSVTAGQVLPLPDEVPFDKGACLPMNYLTAHFALLVRQRVHAGQTILVHGAAGGVGTAVIQLAGAIGARVVAVVSTEAKADVARSAGARDVVLAEGFKDAVRALYPDGVDYVVDPVGGDRFTDSLRCLASLGKLLVIGFAAGEIPTVRANRLLLGNIDVVGVGWGNYAYRHPGFIAHQWEALLPLLRTGVLDPPIGTVLPLERAAEGPAALDGRGVTGKVVLDVR
jgi:NADPH2:quinone reductase